MLTPIHPIFLNQSFTIETYQSDNGKILYAPPRTVNKVCIDVDDGYSKVMDREETVMKNSIYIDVQNSDYESLDMFTKKSKVIIDGNKHRVTTVKKHYNLGTNELHHLEVYCE